VSDCDGPGRSPVLFACGGMYACVFAFCVCVCAGVTGVASAYSCVLCVWPFCCPSRCHCDFLAFLWYECPFFWRGFSERFSAAPPTACCSMSCLSDSLSCGFPLHFFPAGTFFFGDCFTRTWFCFTSPCLSSLPAPLLCRAVFSSLAFRSSALN
jgi:hypothetical protein